MVKLTMAWRHWLREGFHPFSPAAAVRPQQKSGSLRMRLRVGVFLSPSILDCGPFKDKRGVWSPGQA